MTIENTKTKRYKIGEVSKITGLPISKLRYYDKIGLLSPNYRDAESDYRFYDAYQLEEASMIEQWQYFGMSLEQIATLLNHPSHYFENSSTAIRNRLKDLEQELSHLKKIYTKLSALEAYNTYQLEEFQFDGYCLAEMDPQFYILSDLRVDISYPSHYAMATNERAQMYAADRKLPWYYADEFYQMPLKNDATGTTGRFCIRFVTNDTYLSKLPLYREAAEYCIKYMANIDVDDISYHVGRMLEEAKSQGLVPCFNFYYVGELAMESPSIRESALRQIVIPLEKA